MTNPPIVVWFRQDLRIADQPALAAAAETGRPVVPLYVLDDVSPGPWRMGGASRWWLHGSLMSLADDLERLGSPLVLRRGRSADVVAAVARETDAAAVHCTRHVEPFWCAADRELDASAGGPRHKVRRVSRDDAVRAGVDHRPRRQPSARLLGVLARLPGRDAAVVPTTLATAFASAGLRPSEASHWPTGACCRRSRTGQEA